MAVFAGMIGVTLFGLFLTPVFYFVVRWLVERKAPAPAPAEGRDPAAHAIPAVEVSRPLEGDIPELVGATEHSIGIGSFSAFRRP